MVIKADVEELKDKNDDFFLRFDVVVVTGHTTEELVRGVVRNWQGVWLQNLDLVQLMMFLFQGAGKPAMQG